MRIWPSKKEKKRKVGNMVILWWIEHVNVLYMDLQRKLFVCHWEMETWGNGERDILQSPIHVCTVYLSLKI